MCGDVGFVLTVTKVPTKSFYCYTEVPISHVGYIHTYIHNIHTYIRFIESLFTGQLTNYMKL